MPGDSTGRARAVAPVVAVVLLVGVVTVLGAVVATFALDVGEEVQEVGPTTAVDFEYEAGAGDEADCPSGGEIGADRLAVEHGGGDTLQADRITVRGSSVSGANPDFADGCTGLGAAVTAGDSFSVAVESGDAVHVVWRGDDATATLDTWSGPDA